MVSPSSISSGVAKRACTEEAKHPEEGHKIALARPIRSKQHRHVTEVDLLLTDSLSSRIACKSAAYT